MTDLPPGWEWATLGEMASSVKNGIFVSRPGTDPDGVPILRINSVRTMQLKLDDIRYSEKNIDELREQDALLFPGDLLFTRYSGSREYVGVCARVPEGAGTLTYPDKLIRARVPIINSKYLAAAFASPGVRSSVEAVLRTTAGQVGISGSALKNIRIPIAPLAEQRRIVAALEDHFSRIDAATRIVGSAPSVRFALEQAIFEAAVTGQLSNRRADDTSVDMSLEKAKSRLVNTVSGGSRRIRDLPPRATSLLATEKIPDAWRWVEWGQIGHSRNGVAFPSVDYADQGIRLIRPGNLGADGRVAWHPKATRYLPEVYAEHRIDLVVPGRALIMNLTAQSLKDQFLGRTCLKVEDGPALLNQRLAWLEPATGDVEYLLLVFRSPIFRRFVDELNTGSLIQHIHTWQVDKFMIPLPPVEEQRRIIVSVDELLTKITRGISLITITSRRAENLRRSLLSDAFAGRLVSQDPDDEPASVLLERIRAERAVQPKSKRTRRTKEHDTTQETLL